MEVDLEEGGMEWGEYMVIQVKLDIWKPLIHKKKLTIEEIKLAWLSFTYEKLSNFCYGCSLLGHAHKDYT